MLRWIFALLLLCASALPAFAQQARVVSSCGTPGQTYTPGQFGPPTVDTNGNLCFNGSAADLLVNPGTAANWGIGTIGSAPPGNAPYQGVSSSGVTTGVVGCDHHVFKHITTATDTLAVQGVSSETIKVCGYKASFAGTATVYLENTASTNANCLSSNTQITGVDSGVAQSVFGFYAAFWGGLANTAGNGLCINSTGTGGVDVDIWYTQGS